MDIDYISLVSRWAHMLAAITLVGGTLYMRWALLPATGALSGDEQSRLGEALRSKWAMPVHIAVTFLLISGLYNIARIEMEYAVSPLYHALFGIKFLLALAIFFVAISLSGKSKQAQRLRANARLWLNLNMIMAIVLVCISGVLRALDKPPKPAETEETAALAEYELPWIEAV